MKTILFSKLAVVCAVCLLVVSCAIVRPGEVGLKQRLGKLVGQPLSAGPHWFNPFVSKVLIVNVRTVELYEVIPLPTKEGLSVEAQIICLYHVNNPDVQKVYTQFGLNYEKVFVLSNFLATSREVSSRYYAKELYAIEREKVEKVIKEELALHIAEKGFTVDAILLKDIILPAAMTKAIQDKVNAEQTALQMEYVIARQKKESERMVIEAEGNALAKATENKIRVEQAAIQMQYIIDRETKEAERKRIEAEGIRRAQGIIDSSLTPKLLQYNQIEVMRGLVTSPNAKVIISDGKVPVMVTDQK